MEFAADGVDIVVALRRLLLCVAAVQGQLMVTWLASRGARVVVGAAVVLSEELSLLLL